MSSKLDRTTIILILSLIVIPIVCIRFDEALPAQQQETLLDLVKAMIAIGLVCFTTSRLTRNCSQVDKLWSILPIGYCWFVAHRSGYDDRIVIMAAMVTIWGLRLSYNFYRRGGYHLIPWKGEEDYRWKVLRGKPEFQSKGAWFLFELFFISLYQNSLILALTLPALVAWQGGRPLNLLDGIAVLLMLFFIVFETIADQQHYRFHEDKKSLKPGDPGFADTAKGFCTRGLWKYMRHPNYMAEQAIWISFYIFSVAGSGRPVNWSLMGAVLLVLLFRGSASFSESISSGKYPAYADYQKQAGLFLPKWFRKN
ncbi:MAG TPA: DUF1295 domain-containing protein [Saprospiraceae bacterium]|nr:DUF1295 domain-containing protein [Saprospiraceae bacterium]